MRECELSVRRHQLLGKTYEDTLAYVRVTHLERDRAGLTHRVTVILDVMTDHGERNLQAAGKLC